MFKLLPIFGASGCIAAAVLFGISRMILIRREMDEYILAKKVTVEPDGKISGEMIQEYNLLLKKLTLAGSITMFGICAASVLVSVGLSYMGFSRSGVTVAALAIFLTYFCGGCTLGMFASGIWNISPLFIPIGLLLGPVLVGAVLGSFLFGAIIGMLISGPFSGPIIGLVQVGNQGKPLLNAIMKDSQPSFRVDGNRVSQRATFSNAGSDKKKVYTKTEVNDTEHETNQVVTPGFTLKGPMFKGTLVGSVTVQNDGAPLIKFALKNNDGKVIMENNVGKSFVGKYPEEEEDKPQDAKAELPSQDVPSEKDLKVSEKFIEKNELDNKVEV